MAEIFKVLGRGSKAWDLRLDQKEVNTWVFLNPRVAFHLAKFSLIS